MTYPQDPEPHPGPNLTADLAMIGAHAIHEFANQLRGGHTVRALPYAGTLVPATPHAVVSATPPPPVTPTTVMVRPAQGQPWETRAASPMAPMIAGVSFGVAVVGLAWWLVGSLKHIVNTAVDGVAIWSLGGLAKIAVLGMVVVIAGLVVATQGRGVISR